MDKFIIEGNAKLSGNIPISGAKNASLPILAGTLLTKEKVILHNVPNLKDINTMFTLLESLGKTITYKDNTAIVTEKEHDLYEAPYDIVRKMRASIAVAGPLVARQNRAKISLPGGCALGPRPIDLHLKGLKALGCVVSNEHGYLDISTSGLKGTKMNLVGPFGPSVLASENIMMAATLAKGTTIIENSAREPEVIALANFLRAMGAKISGEGSSILTIEGIDHLAGCEFNMPPDRIETGSFIAMAAITKSTLTLNNTHKEDLEKTLQVFEQIGVKFSYPDDHTIIANGETINATSIETLPYPEFPTDMQSSIMAVLTVANGISVIKENIYPERFNHAAELIRMGANIKVETGIATITGVDHLSGTSVMASDLRGGIALVTAALAATGESEILRIYHIDRGYENLEEKLTNIGIKIKRVKQED